MKNFSLTFRWGVFVLFCTISFSAAQAADEPLRMFIGTYTSENGSQGIYTSQFDPLNGTLSEPELAAKCDNPSFLAIHPTQLRLYAIAEQGKGAALYAFSYRKSTGILTSIDTKEIPARSPCHLCLCRLPAFELDAVVVANYTSGNVVSFPIFADGKIGKIAADQPHLGSGPNTARQKTPHPHGVYFDAADQTVAVPDLGIDRVVFYKIDMRTAHLTPKLDQPYLILPPGSGPRHLAFSSDKRFAYVTNELSSTVCVFEMGKKNLPMIQEISTLPEEADKSKNSTAEIELSASGNFLYVSNRGDDSIAVFSTDPVSGKLALIQTLSSGGKHPRFFRLDPSGRFLISCNMETNNIVVFAVDPENGKLTPTETNINVSKPVCAVFAP